MIAVSLNTAAAALGLAAGDPQLDHHQQLMAVGVAVVMLLAVLELVRRRKLREEYSLIWIGTAVVLMAMALQPKLLSLFASAIGAKLPTSALFFGALVFLMSVSMLMSVRLSRLAFRCKALARQTTLAHEELEQLHERIKQLEDAVAVAERRGDDVRQGGAA